jgi:hypothetical protein
MITIVCVLRQGGKVGYDASWVEKLHNSIKRNVTLPYRFLCLSDCDVPVERIPLDNIGEGYWSKLQLFRPNLFSGPVLFFDLDTVICNNIDNLIANILAQDKFLMWQDSDYNISSSAIMFWNGDYSFIYQNYLDNKETFESKYATGNPDRLIGDQAVISTLVDYAFLNDFCPNDWIHVVKKNDHEKELSQARILIFRKAHTKPSTLPNHSLVKQHWK